MEHHHCVGDKTSAFTDDRDVPTSKILSLINLTMFLLGFLSLALAQLPPVFFYNITILSIPSPKLSLERSPRPPPVSRLSKPKVHPINTTVFDWWHFDAVSASNPNASGVITLFTSTPTAFPFLPGKSKSKSNTDSVLAGLPLDLISKWDRDHLRTLSRYIPSDSRRSPRRYPRDLARERRFLCWIRARGVSGYD